MELLASPEFGGRSGAGGEKTGAYLTEQFRRLKLEGLFGGEFPRIPGKEPGTRIGRNVGAMLRGSDPMLREQWVIVAAHYDHLGVRGGKLFPGADDNASGVAMMLEVARCFVQASSPPRSGASCSSASIWKRRGYSARAISSPIPRSRSISIALFITADMIGRALAGVCDGHVFVMGTEHAPGLRPWIDEAGRGRPLIIGLLGADLLVLNRSDYGPFRAGVSRSSSSPPARIRATTRPKTPPTPSIIPS